MYGSGSDEGLSGQRRDSSPLPPGTRYLSDLTTHRHTHSCTAGSSTSHSPHTIHPVRIPFHLAYSFHNHHNFHATSTARDERTPLPQHQHQQPPDCGRASPPHTHTAVQHNNSKRIVGSGVTTGTRRPRGTVTGLAQLSPRRSCVKTAPQRDWAVMRCGDRIRRHGLPAVLAKHV